MTIGTDMRLIFPRWRRGARIRAVKRYAAKAIRSARQFRDDLVALVSMLRPVPADPKMGEVFAHACRDAILGGNTLEREDFIWRARTKAYGVKRARRVERNGTAFVQRRGPHFHDTVQA